MNEFNNELNNEFNNEVKHEFNGEAKHGFTHEASHEFKPEINQRPNHDGAYEKAQGQQAEAGEAAGADNGTQRGRTQRAGRGTGRGSRGGLKALFKSGDKTAEKNKAEGEGGKTAGRTRSTAARRSRVEDKSEGAKQQEALETAARTPRRKASQAAAEAGAEQAAASQSPEKKGRGRKGGRQLTDAAAELKLLADGTAEAVSMAAGAVGSALSEAARPLTKGGKGGQARAEKKTDKRTGKKPDQRADRRGDGRFDFRMELPAEAPRPVKKLPAGAKGVKVIPLGGLDQIGMNITAIEYDDTIVVIDCGLCFPSDDMLGIDLVIPDVSYLKANRSKVKAFVITHGHEDHIGALPYVLKEINVPVYGTRLTIALIENKLKEHGLQNVVKTKVMKFGGTANIGSVKVEYIKTNHSIQDAAALAIHTPVGIVMHTGDFKVDYTPVFGDSIDLQRFAELGKKGVLALLSDSTNATKPGFTMSERTVGRTFDAIFAEHQNNRIIVATFASNVDRVQQVINTAARYDRKVVVEGRSMVNVISVASELGYINIPEGTLIDIESLKNYPDEKTVLITTGSQGESMAALSRMASGMHRKVSIKPSDVVILSSTPIPGNEKAVAKVINELSQKHAEVIFQDTHVSGHACAEEIKLLYSLIDPMYAVPVHGEYRHRRTAAGLAESVGVAHDKCLMIENGDVLFLSESFAGVVEHVQAGGIFVDGLGVGDVGNIVLRDRQNLAQNGIIVVVLTLEKYSGQLLAGPDLVSRGFVYVRESEDLMEAARLHVQAAVDDCLTHRMNDWGKIKNIIKDSLSDFMWKKMKRNPVVLPIIMEV